MFLHIRWTSTASSCVVCPVASQQGVWKSEKRGWASRQCYSLQGVLINESHLSNLRLVLCCCVLTTLCQPASLAQHGHRRWVLVLLKGPERWQMYILGINGNFDRCNHLLLWANRKNALVILDLIMPSFFSLSLSYIFPDVYTVHLWNHPLLMSGM